MNPLYMSAFWIAVSIVTGFLSYRQGRHDEELDWRRALSEKASKITDKRMGKP